MRAVIIFVLALVVAGLLRWLIPDERFDMPDLLDLRTQSTPDESRVQVHARLCSGMKFVHSVTRKRSGDALVLTITGNLLPFVHFGRSSSFDLTLDIPPDVTQIRVGPRRDVLWHRGDCHKRFMDGWRIWHCESEASNPPLQPTASRSA